MNDNFLNFSSLTSSLPKGFHRLAIDIGGSSLKMVALDSESKIREYKSITTKERPVREVLDEAVEQLQKLPIHRCGVGFPGIVSESGEIVGSPNLQHWIGSSLSHELSSRINSTVIATNDANAAAFGESLFGGDHPVQHLLFLTLGTGVGTGLISSGKILCGAGGFAGEGGHITVEPKGALCGCGRVGCLEAHFSGRALSRIALENGYPAGTGAKELFENAQQGDPKAEELLSKAIDHLAIGISGMCALLDPEEVVLGGGISKAGDYLIDRLSFHLQTRLQYPGYSLPHLRISQLGADAGLLGALAL